jgi:hypothetical protein
MAFLIEEAADTANMIQDVDQLESVIIATRQVTVVGTANVLQQPPQQGVGVGASQNLVPRGIVKFAFGYPRLSAEDMIELSLVSSYATITLFTTESRDRIRLENATQADIAVQIYFGTASLRTPPIA